MEDSKDALEITTSPLAAVKQYQESITSLEELSKRLEITKGDIKILEQYFKILSCKPKYATDIKSELRLYNDYIDPAFQSFFGGEEFDVKAIENLVARDETSYIHYLVDDFAFSSLDVKNVIKGFSSEIVYGIVVSDKHKTVSVVFRGSINQQDWLANVQVHGKECNFPGFTGDESLEKQSFGRVHEGFYEYLKKLK
jgi:hypothetical protein